MAQALEFSRRDDWIMVRRRGDEWHRRGRTAHASATSCASPRRYARRAKLLPGPTVWPPSNTLI